MQYRTMLVHLDASGSGDARADFAVRLAKQQGAHLIGLAKTGILGLVYDAVVRGADHAAVAAESEVRQADAQQCVTRFDALARQAGLSSHAHRIDDDAQPDLLAAYALYADLVVLGPSGPACAVPAYAALHAPCPVLVVPDDTMPVLPFERILVAWNASMAAMRAVRLSLPLLVDASQVEVAIIDDGISDGVPVDAAGVMRYLARHGVTAAVRREAADGTAGRHCCDWQPSARRNCL